MAEFTKKLYFKNSAGTQQTAKIYSTTSESQMPYFPLIVDGTQGYAALVSTSDERATSGRVKHSTGNTYAIGTMGAIPYGYSLITTAGAGTFTVPSGVTKLRVTCVGGGAGSAATHCQDTASYRNLSRTAGGITTFDSVSANGATCASFTERAIYDDEEGYSYRVTGYTVSSGTTNGIFRAQGYTENWFMAYKAGADAVSLTRYNGESVATAGAGGGVACPNISGYLDTYEHVLATGASGYKTVSTITVQAGNTLSYSVGSGGYGQVYNNVSMTQGWHPNGGGKTWPGSPGAILVEWGQGIQ